MADDECIFCKIAQKKTQSEIIYEDNEFIAILRQKAAAIGHITLFPKKHHVILEQLPPQEAEDLFYIANKLSVVLFETLGAQGTNIILNNGTDAGQEIPHLSVDIIPRKPDDEINFEWKPSQADQDALKAQGTKISDALLMVEHQAKEQGKKLEEPKVETVLQDNNKEKAPEEKNYLIAQLNRLP